MPPRRYGSGRGSASSTRTIERVLDAAAGLVAEDEFHTATMDDLARRANLNAHDMNALAGYPVVGKSWEGFVIESLLAAAPEGAQAGFYATAAGAEIDLVLAHDLPELSRSALKILADLKKTPPSRKQSVVVPFNVYTSENI